MICGNLHTSGCLHASWKRLCRSSSADGGTPHLFTSRLWFFCLFVFFCTRLNILLKALKYACGCKNPLPQMGERTGHHVFTGAAKQSDRCVSTPPLKPHIQQDGSFNDDGRCPTARQNRCWAPHGAAPGTETVFLWDHGRLLRAE